MSGAARARRKVSLGRLALGGGDLFLAGYAVSRFRCPHLAQRMFLVSPLAVP